MKRQFRIPPELWEIAAGQDGVIGHRQVEALGLSRNVIQRILDDRIVWQVTRGVYSLSPEPTWNGLAWAGVLLARKGAVLGGRSAGFLHGLCAPPDTIEVLAPRRIKNRGCWRFRQVAPPSATGSPPRTQIDDTALALCAWSDGRETLTILADAVASRRTTAKNLLEKALNTPQLPNRRLIVEVLGDVAAGVHSALEERFLRGVIRRHGLPDPLRQESVSAGTRSDNVYREYRLIIELDGQLGHVGSGQWRDFHRDNRHAVDGWTTLRFGWLDVVTRPCDVARQVEQVLRQRGWTGTFRECASCAD